VRKKQRKTAKLLMTTFTFRSPTNLFYGIQFLSHPIHISIIVTHGSKVRRNTLILQSTYILFDHNVFVRIAFFIYVQCGNVQYSRVSLFTPKPSVLQYIDFFCMYLLSFSNVKRDNRAITHRLL
jgi:hypothetical protein